MLIYFLRIYLPSHCAFTSVANPVRVHCGRVGRFTCEQFPTFSLEDIR